MGDRLSGEAYPKAFISYSWDDDDHKQWVRQFATRLRLDGVEVTLDQWELVPGDRLPQFMETAIRENSYVLIVCTLNYKEKSDKRKGGVGYEGDIMTAEAFASANHRKFIPVLRRGNWVTAIPSWLSGKYSIDLSAEPYIEDQYRDLLATLHNLRDQAPPIGAPPSNLKRPEAKREAINNFVPTHEKAVTGFEQVTIVGILADEVGKPANDGTKGSALYSVPFKLSRAPSTEWVNLFVQTWDRPPQCTSRHRPGIARVNGDRIILTRTTIEEIKDTHRETLKIVIDEVNMQIDQFVKSRQAVEAVKREEDQRHKDNVSRIADELKFD